MAEVNVSGLDTSGLVARERRDLMTQLGELLSPCADVPVSIAQCINENRSCKTCMPAAQFLLEQVKAGQARKERDERFHARFDANKVRTIALSDSPRLGPQDAPVTIVEWADFECSACRAVAPIMDALTKRFEGQVALIYKFYPLPKHPHAEIAARAGVAAQNQGKFWEMHHMMFDNQMQLEQRDLEKYAKQLKLDVVRFRADLNADETTQRIEKDRKQADEVGLQGTPTIYVNGRELRLDHLNRDEDLENWIALEIELSGHKPKPKLEAARPLPSASASAGAESASPVAGTSSPTTAKVVEKTK